MVVMGKLFKYFWQQFKKENTLPKNIGLFLFGAEFFLAFLFSLFLEYLQLDYFPKEILQYINSFSSTAKLQEHHQKLIKELSLEGNNIRNVPVEFFQSSILYFSLGGLNLSNNRFNLLIFLN